MELNMYPYTKEGRTAAVAAEGSEHGDDAMSEGGQTGIASKVRGGRRVFSTNFMIYPSKCSKSYFMYTGAWSGRQGVT